MFICFFKICKGYCEPSVLRSLPELRVEQVRIHGAPVYVSIYLFKLGLDTVKAKIVEKAHLPSEKLILSLTIYL